MSVKEWTRTARALALALSTFGMACLDTVPPGASASSPPPPVPPGIATPLGSAARQSISAAMHVHGWSNHGANSRPASIAWHTQQYAAGGVDLIWWTDHADTYFGRVADFRISPTTPSQVLPNTWLVGMWGPNAFGKAFLGGVTPPMLDSATGQVRVMLPGGDSTTADTVEFSLGVIFNDHIRGAGLTMLSRPLIGDPRFTMTVGRHHSSAPCRRPPVRGAFGDWLGDPLLDAAASTGGSASMEHPTGHDARHSSFGCWTGRE